MVLYGIIRLDFSHMNSQIRREVEQKTAPVGRILIDHDVLRSFEIDAYWRIEPSAELCRQLFLEAPMSVYARTAIIKCNGEAAIELLEILAPA